jgi:hypothetical protein
VDSFFLPYTHSMPSKSVARSARKNGLLISVVIGAILLITGLGTVMLLASKSQDLRQQAAGSQVYSCTSNSSCPLGSGLICLNGTCQLPPTPTMSAGNCPAGTNVVPSCTNISGANCGGYQTCHLSGGYSAFAPISGTNTCTYRSETGALCVAECPHTVTGGLSRCQCNNGVWTIGKLPPGGSCETLCGCTGNKVP